MSDTPTRAWDRQPDEPTDWYKRFLLYLNMPYNRSILGAYKIELSQNPERASLCKEKPSAAPASWYQYSTQYHWQDRAIAYDDRIATEFLSNEEELRRISRQKRIKFASTLLDKVQAAIELKEQGELAVESGNALSQAGKTALHELREELEGHSTKTSKEITVILQRLPEGLKDILKEVLQ